MTSEERREYMREYRKANRERIKEQRQKRETNIAVAALENVERITNDVCIIKTIDGRKITLIRKLSSDSKR